MKVFNIGDTVKVIPWSTTGLVLRREESHTDEHMYLVEDVNPPYYTYELVTSELDYLSEVNE